MTKTDAKAAELDSRVDGVEQTAVEMTERLEAMDAGVEALFAKFPTLAKEIEEQKKNLRLVVKEAVAHGCAGTQAAMEFAAKHAAEQASKKASEEMAADAKKASEDTRTRRKRRRKRRSKKPLTL